MLENRFRTRDVAPHDKYCERHLHRGRPRSRKPVEIPINNNNNGGHGERNKKTRVEIPTSTTSQQFVTNEPLLLFNAKSDLNISTNRDLSLVMETDNRWQYVMEPNMGFSNSPIFHQDYIQNQPLDVYSYPSYPHSFGIETPIGFIDAWSINNTTNNGNPKSSLSPNHKNLSTSLDLSMAMATENVLDDEMETIQINDHSDKDSRWSCPVSWEPFVRGGPLAEALQPGSGAVGCTNLGTSSPHDSISNTVSLP